MTEPFTKQNVASMALAAADEIESLRRVNNVLAPKADAFDVIAQILGLLPKRSQGMSEDMAWKLRRRAAELVETVEED